MHNRHHKIGRCERNNYNVHIPENIVRMDERQHNALHQLFRNLSTPRDQLQHLKELYGDILSHHAQDLLEELLSLSDKHFYNSKAIKWK